MKINAKTDIKNADITVEITMTGWEWLGFIEQMTAKEVAVNISLALEDTVGEMLKRVDQPISFDDESKKAMSDSKD